MGLQWVRTRRHQEATSLDTDTTHLGPSAASERRSHHLGNPGWDQVLQATSSHRQIRNGCAVGALAKGSLKSRSGTVNSFILKSRPVLAVSVRQEVSGAGSGRERG